MSARTILSCLLLCALGACAIQEPPSGGKVDNTAAHIVVTSPPADSAGISPHAEIRLGFDEPMTHTRLERSVTAYPRIRIGKIRWKKNTLVLVPEEPLLPDTTYVIEVKAGYSDAHGVKSVETFRFGFATSAAIDSGTISGHVLFRRKPSQKAVVRLFVLPKDTVLAPEATTPDREIGVSPEGAYRFRYLPTNERTFLLWAFEDGDGNGAFGTDRDIAVEVGDSVRLTPQVSVVEGVDVVIVDPKEPGEIAGKIVNLTGVDTFPIAVTAHAVADTARRTYVTRASSTGDFRLSQVLPGRYTLSALMDFRADSLCGTYPCRDDTTRVCIEPCVQHPDTLRIGPGQKVEIGELILEPPETKKE